MKTNSNKFINRRRCTPKFEYNSIKLVDRSLKDAHNEDSISFTNFNSNKHVSNNVQSEIIQVNLNLMPLYLYNKPKLSATNEIQIEDMSNVVSNQIVDNKKNNFLQIKKSIAIRKEIHNRLNLSIIFTNSMSSPNLSRK